MKCYIVLVGTELLNGMTLDTNSVYIAEQLNRYGIEISGKITTGDKIEDIKKSLEYASKNSDLIIVSGGLGPTIDDLTRDAVAEFLNLNLVLEENELEKIKNRYAKLWKNMPQNNIRQAMLPEGAEIIENKTGSAPAFFIKNIAVFPGVPKELMEILPRFLENYSKNKPFLKPMIIKDLIVWGLPESELENRILDVIEKRDKVFVEFLVREYGILVRLLSESGNEKEIDFLKTGIEERIGEFIFGEDEDRLENVVVNLLKNKNYKLSVAESCTGGILSSKIVNVDGSSAVFIEGIVTYANQSKIDRLGVPLEIINEKGAVSEETVSAMLSGMNTDVRAAISGIAGPKGGTEEKPVGTVYIGVQTPDKREIKKYFFRGGRNEVRHRAAMYALDMMRNLLK